jgi:uncharacterized protein (TIGR03086 family)
MDVITTFQKSASATAAIARGIRPEQLDNPTPCTEWNVQDLVNHFTGSLEYFKARGEGKDSVPLRSASPAAYDETIKRLEGVALATAAVWRRPGALEQTIRTRAGEMQGSAMANLALSEMLTHTWDLARATGQRMAAEDIDVDAVLAGMKQTLTPEARQPGFAPEIPAPNEAPPIDRLAAFLGRQP